MKMKKPSQNNKSNTKSITKTDAKKSDKAISQKIEKKIEYLPYDPEDDPRLQMYLQEAEEQKRRAAEHRDCYPG